MSGTDCARCGRDWAHSTASPYNVDQCDIKRSLRRGNLKQADKWGMAGLLVAWEETWKNDPETILRRIRSFLVEAPFNGDYSLLEEIFLQSATLFSFILQALPPDLLGPILNYSPRSDRCKHTMNLLEMSIAFPTQMKIKEVLHTFAHIYYMLPLRADGTFSLGPDLDLFRYLDESVSFWSLLETLVEMVKMHPSVFWVWNLTRVRHAGMRYECKTFSCCGCRF